MSNETPASSVAVKAKDEVFSVRKFLESCLRNWKWFAMSLVFFMGLAVLYLKTKQPVYERSEQILIKDQDGGGGIGDISSAFASMGLVSSNTTVYNELISLTSPAVMAEVVERLHLDMNYNTRVGLMPKTLYGSELPVAVEMKGVGKQDGAGFVMSLFPDGSIELTDFYKYDKAGKKLEFENIVKVPSGAVSVSTPVGAVAFSRNPFFEGKIAEEPLKIKVDHVGLQFTIENYSAALKGDLVDQDAEVIGLTIKDVSVQRAVDILNTVVDVYNENWIEDKNKLARATSTFIDERLKVIQQELGDVDSEIADYKTATMTPSLEAELEATVKRSGELSGEMLEVTNKLAMTSFIRDYITSPAHKYDIVPVNVGIGNDALARSIADYNEVLFARNSLVANSSPANPIVKDYDVRLAGMRDEIERSIKGDISSMEAVLNNMNLAKGRNEGKLREAPGQVKFLQSIMRQQTVKEALYLFLLQKREENELGQTFTAYNTRIITPPTGSLLPVSPKKKLILLVAFVFAVALPGVILYIIESMDNKIRSRKDLEMLPMPFAGEIPRVGKKKRLKVDSSGKKRKKDVAPLSVVEEGKRDIVNEAFRVVRSNLDFMRGRGKETEVWMITSFNPGSGKSFVSYNLGLSFALKGKKVLVIDGDLRHGSSSMYVDSPSKGLSTYLRGMTDDWKSMLKYSRQDDNLAILPTGALPPNPAELLDNGRMSELIGEAKQNFDYIFIDCPPVNIVVDTQILEPYSDRTLFVVRAGLLERGALDELAQFYHERKFRQMSVILNGTDSIHSGYHVYGNYQSVEASR